MLDMRRSRPLEPETGAGWKDDREIERVDIRREPITVKHNGTHILTHSLTQLNTQIRCSLHSQTFYGLAYNCISCRPHLRDRDDDCR